MANYYTDQDRIDAQTMRIDNPNIVGSGYIQFPPQRPFEKPVQMQPPTVAHLEYPQEYQQYTSTGESGPQSVPQPATVPSVQQPQANGSARVPTNPGVVQSTYSNPSQPRSAASQWQGQTPAGRQGYAAASIQHHAGAAQPPVTGYASQQSGVNRAQQARQAPPAPGQQQQPSYQVSASAQRSPNAPSPQYRPAAPARYHTPVPENRGAVPAPAPRPMAPPAPRPLAPAAAVAPSSKEDDDDKATAGLSKAQKQRLRKKLREGKA